MGILKILMCIAIAWGGYQYFVTPRANLGPGSASSQLSADEQRALEKLGISSEGAVVVSRSSTVIDANNEQSDPNVRFVPMPTPEGHSASGVVVFAPANCSKAEGRRADDMMQRLQSSDIPATRASSANFSTAGMTPEDMQNLNKVMAGALPAVFVNGTGKANPSFDEVAAQYRRTKM